MPSFYIRGYSTAPVALADVWVTASSQVKEFEVTPGVYEKYVRATFDFHRSGDTSDALTVTAMHSAATKGETVTSPRTFAAGSNIASFSINYFESQGWQTGDTINLTLLPGTGYTVIEPDEVSILVDFTSAPKFVIEDNVINAAIYLPAPGEISADYEYTTNNESTWSPCDGTYIDLEGVSIPLGHLKVRRKAIGATPAGPAATSTKAYGNAVKVWQGPLVITAGGVYSGRYRSTDPDVPAVDVKTSDFVDLSNVEVEYARIGIKAHFGTHNPTLGHGMGINLRCRNVRGRGLPIVGTLVQNRQFIDIEEYINLDIQHCFFRNSAGIKFVGTYRGNGTTDSIDVRYNVGYNIDCRLSEELSDHKDGYARMHGNFITWGNTKGTEVPNVKIDWNYQLSRMGQSDGEDTISISNARGQAGSYASVSNNHLRGRAYWLYQRHHHGGNTEQYDSGVSILVESPGATNQFRPDTCARYINVEDNLAMDSNGGHFGIASAMDVKMRRNTSISKAMADKADFLKVGGVDQGEYKGNSGGSYMHDNYYNNTNNCQGCEVSDMTYGIVKDYRFSEGYLRKDEFYGGNTNLQQINPHYLPAEEVIDEATINARERSWWNRVAANNLIIGVE
ncbi:hypothetical protein [Pontibacter sp. SGAir0037]|uniref:hypothetical protein n=1 Tax=Pontibacter sp. SGAir0037 TaxID=2571030 RepID=UPI0010CCE0DA|nr:hypothetical protein [Pontibacter sp. SGAir0037]QCR23088.1 hypothetical protein C1N53_12520 [Pontibacter sp. SGAir0037]